MAGADAFGTQFKRGDGAMSEQFTAIANVTNISGPDRQRETIDVTDHDSTDGWMEFLGSLKNGGEVSIDVNYDPRVASHDLDDDFEDSEPRNYQILLFPGTADEYTWDFAGVMTGLSDEFPYDDKMARTATFQISGKPTLSHTAGS